MLSQLTKASEAKQRRSLRNLVSTYRSSRTREERNRTIIKNMFESRKERFNNSLYKCYNQMKQHANRQANRNMNKRQIMKQVFKTMITKQKERASNALTTLL